MSWVVSGVLFISIEYPTVFYQLNKHDDVLSDPPLCCVFIVVVVVVSLRLSLSLLSSLSHQSLVPRCRCGRRRCCCCSCRRWFCCAYAVLGDDETKEGEGVQCRYWKATETYHKKNPCRDWPCQSYAHICRRKQRKNTIWSTKMARALKHLEIHPYPSLYISTAVYGLGRAWLSATV